MTHTHEYHVQIDRDHYTTTSDKLTGADVRALASPPIGADRDLYEVRPGRDDLLISDGDTVDIRDGLRFFSAPRHINPGAGTE